MSTHDMASRVASWADPKYARMVSRQGIALVVLCSLPLLFLNPLLLVHSLIIGLAVGLPGMLLHKYLKRRHINCYVQAATDLGYADRQHWRFVGYNLPVVLSVLVVIIVQVTTGIWFGPGFWVPMALFFLTYPEDRDIARMAKAKLAAMEGPDGQE